MIDPTLPDVITTTALQARASAPTQSAWVSANAGSGKTHVLTQRVIRLLMDGGPQGQGGALPERILCITYTKAAAAEMEIRLFRDLGKWALADDETLKEALAKLGEHAPGPDRLLQVRQLFARALETPGGLKIQTIHAFCESVLRRFPLEAGLLPGFRVIDDSEQAEMRGRIMRKLALGALIDSDTALEHFVRRFRMADDQDSVLAGLIDQMSSVHEEMINSGGRQAYLADLRAIHGLPAGGSIAEWREETMRLVDRAFLRDLDNKASQLAKWVKLGKQAIAAGSALADFEVEPDQAFVTLADGFLNAGWKTPAAVRQPGKEASAIVPDYAHNAQALIDLLSEQVSRERAAAAFEATSAVLDVAIRAHAEYERQKQALGTLDFADLIDRTATLLSGDEGQAAWVMYKLDEGIDHILLDEAQDTALPQWKVIEAFRREFFSGEDDRGRNRTLFVVGDKKQSIYSFQGADADLFDDKLAETKVAIPPPFAFEAVELFLSFRSSQIVLDFVDALFVDMDRSGVHGEKPIEHKSAKPDQYGRVELWPLIGHETDDDGDPWDAPVNKRGKGDPVRRLADQIASQIRQWLDEQTVLSSKGRPIVPGDVLILCQRRSAQFYEILRALARQNVPMAGADRIKLKEDVAVRDLLALLRFAVNTDDSLSLAEALTSPLWDFSEDELFALAYGRGDVPLWSRLRQAADEDGALRQKAALAITEIRTARQQGARLGPYAFLSTLLEQGVPTGWFRFSQRLGAASNEALDELLNEALQFELSEPRSLPLFLSYLENLDADIKKQNEASQDAVRLMTVHGAKGLEAPIVFLADAGHKPTGGHIVRDKMIALASDDERPRPRRGFPVLRPRSGEDDDGPLGRALDLAKQRELEEYRRRFYVAATRAEERLYICGVGRKGAKTVAEQQDAMLKEDPHTASWYALSLKAFHRMEDRVQRRAWGDGDALVMEAGMPATLADQKTAEPLKFVPVPDWMFQPVPDEVERTVQFPSVTEGEDEGPILPPRLRETGRLTPQERGLLIHLLLEILPGIGPDLRRDTAARIVAHRAGDLPAAAQTALIDEVMTILADERFAAIFATAARAEVALQGIVDGKHYSGQVDRLLVTDDEVLVLDYKTHRPPPESVDDMAPAIRRQMRIYAQLLARLYPGRTIRAAILWTHVPRLMPIPAEMLN
ncbi:double-strand break repair helicase AddA [Parvularcula sp. LCG005]|uniref:double-strand break repair helicase AddA n=1 Tax=Parvularcula sp. LCG005 TaxID=3078805 RepID=UPI0029427002|nr:double-strand break repair helicase AddA [Parvularcula sp. LCG005]WOI53500.1 double-strand break repair helicase AddA [Parvularcula sp. LCG005]